MKNLFMATMAITLVMSIKTIAQPGNGAINKEKLSAFSGWIGEWEGEGSMQMGPGPAKKSSVLEKVDFKLDGTILVVEGVGKSIDPATKQEVVVHHAFGILSFDASSQEYKFKTYLIDGKSGDAWFKILESNKYSWGFETPNGKIRYNITIDPAKKTWNEIGEFSRDGAQWMKFFEMNLNKKS